MCNGTGNIAVGKEALMGSSSAANNTGDYNISVGYAAGCTLSTGAYNLFFGYHAGRGSTSTVNSG